MFSNYRSYYNKDRTGLYDWSPYKKWSVTAYNQNLSSQCNVTAQIEPIEEKIHTVTDDDDDI
jgi:hypothetical protein